MHNKLRNGRRYKMLTVLDEYTRQALAVAVRTKMGADDVLETAGSHKLLRFPFVVPLWKVAIFGSDVGDFVLVKVGFPMPQLLSHFCGSAAVSAHSSCSWGFW